jgi:hypothetical protein
MQKAQKKTRSLLTPSLKNNTTLRRGLVASPIWKALGLSFGGFLLFYT